MSCSDSGGDGSYSGGAENFPRFLENWSGKTLTYYGSMVELYQSQQAIGKWTCHAAPFMIRLTGNGILTAISRPSAPGSLMLYSYIKGKWSVL